MVVYPAPYKRWLHERINLPAPIFQSRRDTRLGNGHLLLSYMKYYNGARTHLSLEKDAPISRAVDRAGHILCRPTLGGLHHQYARI